MNKFFKTIKILSCTIGALFLMGIAANSAQADGIEGNWVTPTGGNVQISTCGSSFCSVVTSGKFKGVRIGKLKKKGNKYVGTITDPKDKKSYKGSAKLSGSKLTMTGCAFKIFCKTQSWKRK